MNIFDSTSRLGFPVARLRHCATSLEGPVAQLVEVLRHKPEGRGFDSRWCHWPYG